jgi:retron-type reverse transcriptase
MKRIGNLYEKIYSIDNLILAHKNARKRKKNLLQINMVNKNPQLLNELSEALKNKTYKTSKYRVHTINDNGKEREIAVLPYYPDRIVHWAIMQVIEPLFIRNFIYDTYAAIPNRGPHKACKKIFQSNEDYCLKFDIKKYFSNIDHKTLKSLLEKRFKDKDLLWLLGELIDSYNGIPIGNYTSQYFGNFYLSEFDHWCKETLRINQYYRYMDDVIILGKKEELHKAFIEIKKYINGLKLEIKNNHQIYPINSRGINFGGYVIFKNHIMLRKTIYKRIRRLASKKFTKKVFRTAMSYKGWVNYCDGYKLYNKYINPIRREYENTVRAGA